MHSFFNKSLAISIALLCFANASFAGSVASCDTKSSSGTIFDYGDATATATANSYGEACHDTNRWQQLGAAGQTLEGDSGDDNSANVGWSGEGTQNPVDTGDNGVSWRVQSSDGSWPTDFDNGELTQGDTVEFQFVVTRSNEGNHQFDQLKAWSDWNGNGTFEDSENIIDEKWYKVADTFAAGNNLGNQLGGTNNDPLVGGVKNSGITEAIITVTTDIPYDAVIGDTWMRARIICENSLTEHDRINNLFYATGYYHQGEVEDNKLAINQVPEPTTILLFGSALIGLVLKRKKA
jgi:hypothetical protein